MRARIIAYSITIAATCAVVYLWRIVHLEELTARADWKTADDMRQLVAEHDTEAAMRLHIGLSNDQRKEDNEMAVMRVKAVEVEQDGDTAQG